LFTEYSESAEAENENTEDSDAYQNTADIASDYDEEKGQYLN